MLVLSQFSDYFPIGVIIVDGLIIEIVRYATCCIGKLLLTSIVSYSYEKSLLANIHYTSL